MFYYETNKNYNLEKRDLIKLFEGNNVRYIWDDDEEIKDYLGDDFKQVGLITGSISSNGNSSGKAIFSYRVKGKNGKSLVFIDAYKVNGVWSFNQLDFYKELNSAECINLLENK